MKIFSALFGAVFCLLLGLPQGRASSICSTVPNNLVANCGFETGDFTAWTLSGNDVPIELGNLYGVEGADPFDGISPFSGLFQAYFADLVSNATTLSQTLATVPGKVYTVSWLLAQDTAVGTGYTNAFSASFNGAPLVNLAAVPVEGYTKYSYTGLATGSSTVLSLTLGDDLGEFLLDDVEVAVAPEPAAWQLGMGGLCLACLLARKGRNRTGPVSK